MDVDKRFDVAAAIYLIYGEDDMLHAGKIHGCSVGERSGKGKKAVKVANNR